MAAVHEERICKFCGKTFIISDARQIYCSRECQIKFNNHKNSNNRKNSASMEKICKFCGKAFITSDTKKIYCSKKCCQERSKSQKRFNNHRNLDIMGQGNNCPTDKAYIDRVSAFTSKFEYIGNTGKEDDACYYLQCKDCGAIKLRSKQSFKPSKASKTKIICTNCNEIIKDVKRREERELKQREREALKEQRKERREKERELERQRKEREKKEREPRIVTSICARCGKEFTYVGNRGKRKYCSELCAKRQQCSNHEHARRMRQGSGKKDSISLPLLVKRDKCKCWICGKKIDYKDYEVRDNGAFIAGLNYPSIDHVVPLSKGGTHTWDNVRLAHRHCNTKKNNGMYFEGRNGQIMFSV